MSGKVEFKISVGKLNEKLRAAMPAARLEVKKEMYQFANEVLGVSLERVPMDTGALANSGRVEPPTDNGNEISVKLGYGGVAVNYAWHVHENMNPNVRWSRPGSGPKYLEGPLKEVQDTFPGRIKDAVARGFKK